MRVRPAFPWVAIVGHYELTGHAVGRRPQREGECLSPATNHRVGAKKLKMAEIKRRITVIVNRAMKSLVARRPSRLTKCSHRSMEIWGAGSNVIHEPLSAVTALSGDSPSQRNSSSVTMAASRPRSYGPVR